MMNLEPATYLSLILALLGFILAFYFYKKSKIITEKIADDVSSMMPKTRQQEIKHIKKKLSKATNQQLASMLIECASTFTQAQNTGAMIRAENGLEIGMTIIEYLKRTDKSVKKALQKSGV